MQSYGQCVRAGYKEMVPSPGDACRGGVEFGGDPFRTTPTPARVRRGRLVHAGSVAPWTDDPEPEPTHEPDAPSPNTPSRRCRTACGPWPGGPSAWPTDPHYDPELLEHGDTRNVVDRYRYWRMEAIVADLDTHRHPFHVAIENWQHDLNIGSIVRSANAFAAETVHIIGRRRWNKRGAMVTDRYQHVLLPPGCRRLRRVGARRQSLPIIAVDNVEGSVPVDAVELPERCVLLFGQEGPGPQRRGDRRSRRRRRDHAVRLDPLDQREAAAAAIVMHEWVRRHAASLIATPA